MAELTHNMQVLALTPVEDLQEGDMIDLEDWFKDRYNADYLEQIENAYDMYDADERHDDNREECPLNQDGGSCDCPGPDPGLVEHGKVWAHIRSEYQRVDAAVSDSLSKVKAIRISSPSEVNGAYRTFIIRMGTRIPKEIWKQVSSQTYSQQAQWVRGLGGNRNNSPVQPPKKAKTADFPLGA